MDSIFRRRSIRKYTSENVSDEQLEQILRAGMAAPSAGNEQPWHFVIIRDRAILDGIREFHRYARMLAQAPCAVAVCADTTHNKYESFWVQDCAAATENMLIEAQELGLGAVWLGIYSIAEYVQKLTPLLGLPASITPFCIVSIGHPAETVEPADRFDPSRIHQDKW